MDGSPNVSNVTGDGDIPYDYSASENSQYSTRPPTFNNDSTQFEWWKSKMYSYIIGLDDELWNILEDGLNIEVNSIGIVADRKTTTPTQKKIFRKHHRVRGILIEALPHSKYINIIDKSTAKTISESLCSIYEGNLQVK